MKKESAMKSDPITSASELFDALDHLTIRSKRGELSNDIMSILFETMDQLMNAEPKLRNRGLTSPDQVNQREKYRVSTPGKGKLIHNNRESKASIIDMSVQGFGVKVSKSMPLRANVMFEVKNSREGGKDLYSCYVQNCRRDGKEFRIGLRIFDMLPRY